MSTPSIRLNPTPAVRDVLRLADTCLIHAQRLAEWCGHAPVLEEDLALTNLSLDLLGQARALLTHAAALDGQGFDEDQLAFLRDERDYLNLTLVELPLRRSSAHAPGGDFADTVVRNLLVCLWLRLHWEALLASPDAELAAIAAKALKEARYHVEHVSDWVIRLGDGTDESHRRMQAALDQAWPYVGELFEDAAGSLRESRSARWGTDEPGLCPARSLLREPWMTVIDGVLAEAGLRRPDASPWVASGSQGVHSEHMGYILAEMQSLQRSHPGGVW
jgi:ring-1,2-phenylacetyl-CoA epoxidase subunit PaaC